VPQPVAGVLLAAGGGSRLGQPKALVVVGGQTLAHRGIALLRAGGTDPVIVVTGATGPDSIGDGTPGADAGGDGAPSAGAPSAGAPGAGAPSAGAPSAGAGSSDPGSAGPDAAEAGSGDADTSPRTCEPGLIRVHNPDWQTGMGSSVATGLGAVPAHCDAAVLALVDQPLISSGAVRRLLAAHAAGASVAVSCYAGRPRNPVLIGREHWPEVIALAVGDVGARPFLTNVECGDIGRPDDVDSPDDLARVEALLASATPFPA